MSWTLEVFDMLGTGTPMRISMHVSADAARTKATHTRQESGSASTIWFRILDPKGRLHQYCHPSARGHIRWFWG